MHLLCSLLWSGVEWVVVWVCPGVRLMLTLLPSVRRSRTWGRRVPLVTGSPLLSSPASCSFRCLQLPQATLTSHPYSLHYSTTTLLYETIHIFLEKPPSLIPLHNRQGSAFPSFISSSLIHVVKLERDNNILFVKNTDIKLVSYFSQRQ